ncbi:Uu.00g022480.m01.CDS01 [Anthostomella pinea]|uniref:Uu.00g022480.m01.CDS01 n=1 Tax=Anthostomella pinea TaxID=933095 RepID=A0AAI8W0I1_9PEZI|nr:Uu.00g022480.m01.CDS01 [Anthostomella pinea]
MEPPAKRRRLSDGDAGRDRKASSSSRAPASLSHPISPPRKKTVEKTVKERRLLPSPFRLTTITDLPPESNVGAVSLKDLLGDPLIAECWEFNYLHDVDFLISHFDEDTRSLVKVHVVHGFWKREDPNMLALEEQAGQRKNVTLHTAFMPEMFGTHHSKMMILLRHDDTAQIIIHTANMISKDWTNMTNGVWQSPRLPQLKAAQGSPEIDTTRVGSGHRFKIDLLNYLQAYNTRRDVCKSLVENLAKYDFCAVRGALVASVPGKHDVDQDLEKTRWGWQGLKQAVKSVPVQDGKSEIVVQISSIATLGGTDAWLQRTLFDALSASSSSKSKPTKPSFKIVFPTPDEIRRSLDGYASGGSIHTKIQSAAQAKQLQYMRPIFHHWANDCEKGIAPEGAEPKDAGRQRGAPHIKTYIRYGENSTIDWALLTSANISKQAWGEATNKAGEVRIASWEIGVLVWPELLTDDPRARMVGTFKTDIPVKDDFDGESETPLVGLRIPYSLPLQRYGNAEVPWVATASYTEPDWKGGVWGGW